MQKLSRIEPNDQTLERGESTASAGGTTWKRRVVRLLQWVAGTKAWRALSAVVYRVSKSELMVECALAVMFWIIASRFWPHSASVWPTALGVGIVSLLCGLGMRATGMSPTRRRWARCALQTLLVYGAARFLPGAVAVPVVFQAFLVLALQVYRVPAHVALRHAPSRPYDALRAGVIVMATAVIFEGLAFPVRHGTGDAVWYGTVLADVIEQSREGVFPIFGGQSVYQFNGSIYPLRIAPGFHYLGMITDILSGRSLGAFAVQNLWIFLWGIVAVVSTYSVLLSILPHRRNWAVLLALLYISCPGVCGLPYNTDLYMSWATVPFVSAAFLGVAKFRDGVTYRRAVFVGWALGLTWWGHTPIALWSTLLLTLSSLVYMATHRERVRREARPLLAAAGAFFIVVLFPVGGSILFRAEQGIEASSMQHADVPAIMMFIKEAFPRNILPLADGGRGIASFQLGYALSILLVAMAVVGLRQVRGHLLVWWGIAVTLVLLLYPFPAVTPALWGAMPQTLKDVTGNWVMNRLYLVLSATVVTLAALFLGQVRLSPRANRNAYLAAVVLLGWSLYQATVFGRFSHLSRHPISGPESYLVPENAVITRFAYILLPQAPATFTHGVTNPELEHRILDENGNEIGSNRQAILEAWKEGDARVRVVDAGKLVPDDELGQTWKTERKLVIEPGKQYVAHVRFPPGFAASGVIQAIGPRLFRLYGLPEYGGARSFGNLETSSPLVPFWNTGTERDEVEFTFVHTATPYSEAPGGIEVTLLEYDRTLLPVQVEDWIPYRARVNAVGAAWIETPRSFNQALRSDLPVAKSSEGLAMVKAPAGGDTVTLWYDVPILFYGMFFLSAGFIIAATARLAYHPRLMHHA